MLVTSTFGSYVVAVVWFRPRNQITRLDGCTPATRWPFQVDTHNDKEIQDCLICKSLSRSLNTVQDSRRDAVCVKVASSLTFCAHGSLQSFSKSDKIKRPKTDPPGGTTFDPKRVHFWTPFEIHLLCARVQNWALDILSPVPPWGPV